MRAGDKALHIDPDGRDVVYVGDEQFLVTSAHELAGK
jgi:hypothetical protein